MAANQTAYLPLALPGGSRITGITVTYNDVNAGELQVNLYSLSGPSPSGISPKIGALKSVNTQTTGTMVFASSPPAVSGAAVPESRSSHQGTSRSSVAL